MRRVAVLAVALLAFAAGWFGRGCAGDGAAPSDATSSNAAPTSNAPARRAVTTSRDDAAGRSQSSAADGKAAPHDDAGFDESSADEPDAGTNLPDTVTGIVVDALSGGPVAGATIHLCAYGDDGALGWTGESTDDAGRFVAESADGWSAHARRLEVIAARDGYRPARVPAATPEIRIELERLEHSPQPGRVVGTALDEDDKPLTGRILVHIVDDLDMHGSMTWALADANGRFRITGVGPGHWKLRIAESEDESEVNVIEGQDTPVELRARFEVPHRGAFVEGVLTEEVYLRCRRWVTGEQRQQLELQWLRDAPGRDIVVTGLSGTDGAFVRLERREGARCEWRATITDSRATFPTIPCGKWRAVLVRPGEADVAADVDLKAGDGAFEVAVSPAK